MFKPSENQNPTPRNWDDWIVSNNVDAFCGFNSLNDLNGLNVLNSFVREYSWG